MLSFASVIDILQQNEIICGKRGEMEGGVVSLRKWGVAMMLGFGRL